MLTSANVSHYGHVIACIIVVSITLDMEEASQLAGWLDGLSPYKPCKTACGLV